jgi:hypothetical protein
MARKMLIDGLLSQPNGGRKATTILTCLSLELEAAVFVLQEQGGGKEGRRVFVEE